MSQTAGLIRGSFAPGSRYDLLALRETEAAWAPGKRYHYSNVGYQALGYLLEDLLNLPYPDILRTHLLAPLGMHAGAPAIAHALRPRLATGYTSLYTDRPLKESAYTRAVKEQTVSYRVSPDDKSNMAKYLFGGLSKCLYQVQKFDSDAERRLAVILERDAIIPQSVRPQSLRQCITF